MLSKEGQGVSSLCIKLRESRGIFSSLEISPLGQGQPRQFLFLVFSGLEVRAVTQICAKSA